MLRLPLLLIAFGTLAQLVVPGCPSNSTTTPTSTDRGRIDTSASTTAGASVSVGQKITLTASAAGDDVSYSWLQTAGPGVQIENADSSTASFVAPSIADRKTLRFQVTTHNGAGDVGSAETKVIIDADPNFDSNNSNLNSTTSTGTVLIAQAGADKSAEEGTSVQLSARNSSGPIATYQWRQTSGASVTLSAPTQATTSFTAPAFESGGNNTLEFELTIRDSGGKSSRDRIFVMITKSADNTGNNNSTLPRVRVKTTLGNFTLELDDKKSPKTVANFLKYVDEGFYTNVIFHRVVPNFVIQAGGYSAGLVEKAPTHAAVMHEAPNGLSNVRGTVSMALQANNPDSGTSQFFVNLVDNKFLDDQQFTVFARVVDGMGTVDQIGAEPTTTRNGLSDVPVTDIIITGVDRL